MKLLGAGLAALAATARAVSDCDNIAEEGDCVAYQANSNGIGPCRWTKKKRTGRGEDQVFCRSLEDACADEPRHRCLRKVSKTPELDRGCIWNVAADQCEVAPVERNCRLMDGFRSGCQRYPGCTHWNGRGPNTECCNEQNPWHDCETRCAELEINQCFRAQKRGLCVRKHAKPDMGIEWSCEDWPEASDWTTGIELVNGPVPNAGRVELIDQHGNRGTICEDMFYHNNNGAQVICRQMGYEGGIWERYGFGNKAGGSRRHPIVLDKLQCDGTENSWDECAYNDMSVGDCQHREKIGVYCDVPGEPVDCSQFENRKSWQRPLCSRHPGCWIKEINKSGSQWECRPISEKPVDPVFPDPSDWSVGIELVGGKGPYTGRVVLTDQYGRKGGMCDDLFEENHNGAKVICRMLGFEGGYKSRPPVNRDTTMVLNEVFCDGTENSWTECGSLPPTPEICRKSESAGVTCVNPATSSITVELVGGSVPHEGRIELVDTNGERYTICNDRFDRNNNGAEVICREAGFSGGRPTMDFGPGHEDLIIGLDNFKCTGTESSWRECSYQHWGKSNCDHVEDVGVICDP